MTMICTVAEHRFPCSLVNEILKAAFLPISDFYSVIAHELVTDAVSVCLYLAEERYH